MHVLHRSTKIVCVLIYMMHLIHRSTKFLCVCMYMIHHIHACPTQIYKKCVCSYDYDPSHTCMSYIDLQKLCVFVCICSILYMHVLHRSTKIVSVRTYMINLIHPCPIQIYKNGVSLYVYDPSYTCMSHIDLQKKCACSYIYDSSYTCMSYIDLKKLSVFVHI